jgi:hypothetical protein
VSYRHQEVRRTAVTAQAITKQHYDQDMAQKYQRDKGLLETSELSQALLTHMLRNGG